MSFLLDDDITPDCQINLQWIAGRDGGSTDPPCREMILDFFNYLDPAEYLIPLEKIVKRFSKVHKTEFEARSKEEFLDYLKAKLNDKYEFTDSNVILLGQDIEICYQRSDFHKDFFPFFFSYRLSKRPFVRIKDFLTYNLTRNFEGNLDGLLYFVKDVISKQTNAPVDKNKTEAALNCLELLKKESAHYVVPPPADEIQWAKIQIRERAGEVHDVKTRNKPYPYTQDQIALGIYYKQMAGTFKDWNESDRVKMKELKEIAKQHGDISPTNLTKSYNRFAIHKNRLDNRLTFIAKSRNSDAVKSYLKDDNKAIAELNKELIKNWGPQLGGPG
jgi:hypothetical protein